MRSSSRTERKKLINSLGRRQAEKDSAPWKAGDHVAEYANRVLRPVEAVLLPPYRDVLSRRVSEIGCGAGRLLALGDKVYRIDGSPAMVDYSRRSYPGAAVCIGDLRASLRP